MARKSLSKLRKEVGELEVSNSKLQRKQKRVEEQVAIVEDQKVRQRAIHCLEGKGGGGGGGYCTCRIDRGGLVCFIKCRAA